jgi:hypothetical protein
MTIQAALAILNDMLNRHSTLEGAVTTSAHAKAAWVDVDLGAGDSATISLREAAAGIQVNLAFSEFALSSTVNGTLLTIQRMQALLSVYESMAIRFAPTK